MSEETGSSEQKPQEGTQAKTETFDADYVKKLRDEAAKYRTEARANASAAEKLQQFEDRDKTETQKFADQAKAAEERATKAEQRAMRLEVAAEKGLTPTQAKRLVGGTREELEADAAELLETFKPATDQQSEAVAASLDLGTRGGTAKQGKSTADLFAAAIDSSFTR